MSEKYGFKDDVLNTFRDFVGCWLAYECGDKAKCIFSLGHYPSQTVNISSGLRRPASISRIPSRT